MSYTTGEMAAKFGLTKDGLRYYEKEGLLPPIARNESGHRVYSESDAEWIFLIRCLRDTDMPIYKIKKYVTLLIERGGDSIPERYNMLKEHQLFLKEKMKTYINLSKLIDKKLDYYDHATEETRCLDYAAEWEYFRSILGGIKHD